MAKDKEKQNGEESQAAPESKIDRLNKAYEALKPTLHPDQREFFDALLAAL